MCMDRTIQYVVPGQYGGRTVRTVLPEPTMVVDGVMAFIASK
jgi:hypothetical protein